MADWESEFARYRARLEQTSAEHRAERLDDFRRRVGWTTLRGRGGRARFLRKADFTDIDTGHPFARHAGRQRLPISDLTIMVLLVPAHHFLDHLRRDIPPAARAAHVRDAPDWMRAAFLNARAALDAYDRATLEARDEVALYARDARWDVAKARLARLLVADQLGRIDPLTVKRRERAFWATSTTTRG